MPARAGKVLLLSGSAESLIGPVFLPVASASWTKVCTSIFGFEIDSAWKQNLLDLLRLDILFGGGPSGLHSVASKQSMRGRPLFEELSG